MSIMSEVRATRDVSFYIDGESYTEKEIRQIHKDLCGIVELLDLHESLETKTHHD